MVYVYCKGRPECARTGRVRFPIIYLRNVKYGRFVLHLRWIDRKTAVTKVTYRIESIEHS